MKPRVLLFALFLTGSGSAQILAPSGGESPPVLGAFGQPSEIAELNGIAAIVNDDVIVQTELRNRLRSVKSRLRQSGTLPPSDRVLVRQVLERLVLERLQLELATQSGIRVDENQLNQSIADMARRNGLSLSQFRDVIERDGFNFADFREEIRNEMLISEVRRREVGNRVSVSEQEVDNFLANQDLQGDSAAEYRLAHILIAVPEGASDEQIGAAEARTLELLQALRAGEDFAQTAAAVSDGQQALQGGDLGWRTKDKLPTLAADVIVSMKPGEITDPIRSTSGFHLVKLVERRGGAKQVITQALARHILVRTDELTSDDDARRHLEQLKDRLEQGDEFGDLARSHSDDTGSAANDGSLGWVNPGEVVPRFEMEMNKLAPGEISDPFKTRFGWHVLQVQERREHDSTQEVRRAKAVEEIRERRLEEGMQTWLRQLRDEAYVELRLDQ